MANDGIKEQLQELAKLCRKVSDAADNLGLYLPESVPDAFNPADLSAMTDHDLEAHGKKHNRLWSELSHKARWYADITDTLSQMASADFPRMISECTALSDGLSKLSQAHYSENIAVTAEQARRLERERKYAGLSPEAAALIDEIVAERMQAQG